MAEKVIFVDDDVNVLNSLKRALKKEGYETVFFASAQEALDYLAANDVEVIVSDQKMPKMTGMDFLIETRKTHPDSVRILLTGYAEKEVAIKGVNEGKLFRFLTKPWDEDELKMTLKNALHLAAAIKENRKLIEQIEEQKAYLEMIEKTHPGISKLKKDKNGAIILEEE